MPPIAKADSYAVTAGQPVYAGRMGAPPPGVDALLTTLTLQNTSATEQAAGFVSPMFGLPLKQGDMPAGQYPQFKLTDGTNCPASIWGVSSWPDGSMKFCAAMVRVPTSVAGSDALTLQIYSGGTAPAPGTRTTADLTAADLNVELTGVTNLSGAWTASLNTAIADADDIVVIGDGPAGKVWRIGGPCKQAGAAHGQLHAWHYVAALTNSAGGLLGLRYLGRIAQPWVDVTTPTPTRRVVTAELTAGAATLRSLQGHDTTETVGVNIGIAHYTSFFTAGADARWDFVPGGGSAAADCTVRVVHNKTDVVRSRLVPPYDVTVSPTSSSSVDYAPFAPALMTRNMGTTGERSDIGLLPSWYARHILSQSTVDERVVRVTGLCSGGWRQTMRRVSTKEIVPLNTGTYAGMGTSQPTWENKLSSTTGFVLPADTSSLWSSEHEPSHRPGAVYYPYVLTGEPQYLDMLAEQANGIMSYCNGGTANTFATAPITGSAFASGGSERNYTVGATTYYCCATLLSSNLSRLAAWHLRDWVHLLAVSPDVSPSGSAVKAYAQDVVNSSFDMINAYNASQSAGWQAGGFYYFRGTDQPSEAGWTLGYLSCSVASACAVLGNPTNATTFRDHLAKFWRGYHDRNDIAGVATFSFTNRDETGTRVENLDNIMADLASGSMSWSSTTDTFTVGAGGSGNFNYTPTNGDKIGFSTYFSANKPFASTPDRKQYYVVQASGQTFKLSDTPGGDPLDVTTDLTVTRMWATLANFSPRYAFSDSGASGGSGYLANTRGAMRLMEATGNINIQPARIAHDDNWVAANGTFTADPKYAFTETYPA